MVDPIDWGIVVESPVFWGAVMGLIGILAGHYGARKNKKEDIEFAALQANVSFLQAEYKRLNEEVKTLRSDMEKARRSKRVLNEKYSAALQVILSGKIWFEAILPLIEKANIVVEGYPTIPEMLTEDMPVLHGEEKS